MTRLITLPCPRRRGDWMKWLTAAVVIPLIAILTITPTAMAQAGQITVGLLSLHSAEHEKAGNIGATAFRAGMQALGYSEGQNFHLHERHADGDAALLSSLTAELLTKRVDVIGAVGTD